MTETALSFAIRPMTREDLPVIATLERAIFAADAWPLSTFRRDLTNPRKYYRIAVREDGTVLGYGALWPTRQGGTIANLAVIPEARGRGPGRGCWRR